MYEKNNTSHKSSDERGWPKPLDDLAYHGLLGEIVCAIAPHTEADPAAILLQLVVAVGNLIGRNPAFRVEATRHGANLFAVIVARSSRGRKGTSWNWIPRFLHPIDPMWANVRIKSGLSSGEGLIEQVKDNSNKEEEQGKPEPDRRLLVVEGEFSRVLKMQNREGNTLIDVLRLAWDDTNLQTLARTRNALYSTDPHISVIGHITRDDLRRNFTTTDAANGFGNRILWAAVKRSQLLPHGSEFPPAEESRLIQLLRQAIQRAKLVRRLERDKDANACWEAIYPDLTRDPPPGMFGSVISRSEAQVMRLSMIYALLDMDKLGRDGTHSIRPAHLFAAQEVWRFCEHPEIGIGRAPAMNKQNIDWKGWITLGISIAVLVVGATIWLSTQFEGIDTHLSKMDRRLDKYDAIIRILSKSQSNDMQGLINELLSEAKELATEGKPQSAQKFIEVASKLTQQQAVKRAPASRQFFAIAVAQLNQIKASGLETRARQSRVALAEYRSSLNTLPIGFVPTIVFSGSLPNVQVPLHEGELYENTPVILDNQQWVKCVFNHARIIYRGGPIRLDGVVFVNCVFEVANTPPSDDLLDYAILDKTSALINWRG